MQRRDFITLLGGSAAAWPLAARAQQSGAVKRVGLIVGASSELDPRVRAEVQTILEGLAKLGWKEGANLRLDLRTSFGGDPGRRRQTAAELVRAAPDIILCTGTQQTMVFQQLTTTIPIVFVNVADPVATGIVASFARPGGNITGFVSVEFSLGGKWLSLLKDIAPGITRVLVLYDPGNSNWVGYRPVIEAAAAAMGIDLTTASVITLPEVEQAIDEFARVPQSGRAGMIVIPAVLSSNRETLGGLAVRHRLAAIYPYDFYAESGGLVSYGSNSLDIYRRAVAYVDRILRGEKPADLPVQAPVKFELVINLKAAKAIGLEVPYNVLLLADRVID